LGRIKGRKHGYWRTIRMIIRIRGFEEFYVEQPMRPKETEELELLYDLTLCRNVPPCGTTLQLVSVVRKRSSDGTMQPVVSTPTKNVFHPLSNLLWHFALSIPSIPAPSFSL
jgi:hypothetical protein